MQKTKVLMISALVNFCLVILKIIGGLVGSSQTLLSDGFHSMSDLVGDFVSIVGAKVSQKPADKEHPFGHGKLENLISMVIGVLIVFVGITLLRSTFGKEAATPSKYLIILSAITIITKYFLSKYLEKRGYSLSSEIVISSAKESKMDVVTSVFGLIAIALTQFSNRVEWLKYMDLAGGIMISTMIIYVGLNIIKDQTGEILVREEQNDNKYQKIDLYATNLGMEIKDIKFIKFGSNYLTLIQLLIDDDLTVKQANELLENLRKKIKTINNIQYIFIETLSK